MLHFFTKVTLFLKVLLKDVVVMNNAKTPNLIKKMRRANDKLEQIIYGKTFSTLITIGRSSGIPHQYLPVQFRYSGG